MDIILLAGYSMFFVFGYIGAVPVFSLALLASVCISSGFVRKRKDLLLTISFLPLYLSLLLLFPKITTEYLNTIVVWLLITIIPTLAIIASVALARHRPSKGKYALAALTLIIAGLPFTAAFFIATPWLK